MPSCSVEGCPNKHYAKTYCEKHYARWRKWGDPLRVDTVPYQTISNADPEKRRQRLLARIAVDDATGCWVWQGTKTAAGYGQMRGGSKVKVYTHRVSYELHRGPIPDGLVLDHLCRNPPCCNPDHLEPVPQLINARRGERGMKTHCPRGHEYAGDNLRLSKHGHRQCRACHKLYAKERWQKQLAEREGA